jgi:hypothetical protein
MNIRKKFYKIGQLSFDVLGKVFQVSCPITLVNLDSITNFQPFPDRFSLPGAGAGGYGGGGGRTRTLYLGATSHVFYYCATAA